MKTALYAPLYLDGIDPLGNPREPRNRRYVQWNLKIKEQLGFNDIWFCDNGSSPSRIYRLIEEFPNLNIMRFPNIKRTNKENGYIYCWRALWFMGALIQMGYEKIIFLDTDAFVVSNRLASFIKNMDSGWTAFLDNKYNFPTAECHVLCKDSFGRFKKYTRGDYSRKDGILMEHDITYDINNSFKCGRWGEDRVRQEPWMDLYSQASDRQMLTFTE